MFSRPRLRLSLCLLLAPLLHHGVAAPAQDGRLSGGRADSAARAVPSAVENADAPAGMSTAAFGELPLSFEENRGQTGANVKFRARGYGYDLQLSADKTVLSLCNSARARAAAGGGACRAVTMRLAGARREPRVEGLDPLRGKANYFTGADPAGWVTDVPTFGRVRYRGVYSGIDLEFYGNQRQLEYDFIVAPNADPGRVRLRFDGAERIRLDAATGDLLLGVAGGEIRQRRPVLYQLKDGVRREVRGRYVLGGRGEVSFSVGAYDRRLPLVIDPVLVYSTYLGDGRENRAAAVAIDAAGSAYVVGDSETLDDSATREVFVMKLSPAGTELEYAAHVGGAGEDTARAVVVDAKGNAAIAGETASADFPVTANAYQAAPGRTFLAKLNETGSEITYATYFGGDSVSALASDDAGRLYVAGAARASNLRTTPGVVQPNAAGDAASQDAFVAKFDPAIAGAQSLLFATFLGGAGQDAAAGLAVDPTGNVYVVGRTDSADFPLKNQLAAGRAGGGDAFLSKLNPAASALLYSTLLAGEGADYAVGVALDVAARAHVAGVTHSDAFPVTASAVQPKKDLDTCTAADGSTVNCPDAFVARIDTTRTGDAALLYSTYVGGAKEDTAAAVAVDQAGNVYVAGATSSLNFPVINSTQDHLVVGDCGGGDSFLVKLNPARSGIDSLLFSTYLGGECNDAASGVAADREGNAYVAGYTLSREFPVHDAAQPDGGGHGDAFVAKLDTDPDVGCQYTLTPASRQFTSAGGSGSSNLTTAADCSWELASDDPWITLTSAASGSGNKAITYTVAPNPAADNRSGTITLTGAAGVKRTLTVSQTSCYAITPASKAVGPDGAAGTVAVTAGASCATWTAASSVPWITITAGASGSGSGTVAYTVAPNSGPDARQGKLTVAGKTHTVNQAGCYAITPTSRLFGPDAATGTVGVTAGDSCAGWTAASNVPWITITSGHGATGDGTVSYSVAANPELTSRSGTLTVAGKTHTVTQSGCFAISPSSIEYGPGAGSGEVVVTAGAACPGWTAASNVPWVTITSVASGAGGGEVTYAVAPNTSGAARSGTLTVAGKTHSVRQLGCYGISPSSKSAGPNAQTGSVSVSAGPACAPWTAVSDSPWLAVTSTTAVAGGLGTVNYSIAATTSDEPRTGKIKIGDKTFAVTQAACSVISPAQDAAPDFPSTGTLNVTFGTGCSPWTAVSNVPWIVIVSGGTGAAGTSKVTYSVKANLDAQPRTGTITVGSRTFTVTQAADPTPQRVIQFSAPAFQHGEDAVGAAVTLTRTGDAATAVSVGFTTVDDPAAVPCDPAARRPDGTPYPQGTAYARCDYATTIDTVHFAAGETQKQISVPVIDDAHVEGAEVVRLRLVNPAGGATLGAQATATLTITDNDQTGATPNPVDKNALFVRMQYLDFLSREPEAGEPWTGVLDRCPNVNNDSSCDRLLVSQSFFQSPESQLKALYAYLFYRVAFNRRPEYAEIVPDMRSLAGATAEEVYARRAAYANAVAQRAEFTQLYNGMTNQRYVDTLLGRHGLQQITTESPQDFEGAAQVTLTRQQLIDALNGNAMTKAQVLRAVVQSSEVDAAEYHGAFVSMQYYGYLRRTPEQSGYDAWVRVIKQDPGNVRQMVSGFVNSQEYRLRFGQP